jgi:hypothetical protein
MHQIKSRREGRRPRGAKVAGETACSRYRPTKLPIIPFFGHVGSPAFQNRDRLFAAKQRRSTVTARHLYLDENDMAI